MRENNATDLDGLLKKVSKELINYLDVSRAGIPKVVDQLPADQLAHKLQVKDWIRGEGINESNVLDFLQPYLEHSQHMHHPHYVGHQVAVPHYGSALADLIHGVINNPMAIYEMGPSASVIEVSMVNWLLKKIGWFQHDDISDFSHHPSNGAGVFTHGGSMANLTAMLSARAACAPEAWTQGTPSDLVILGSASWHYSISRAIAIMGMPQQSFIPIQTDKNEVLLVESLKEAYEQAIADGKRVMAVVANACTTSTGLYDPIDEIGQFCNDHNIWYHVDGAHGAAALLSPKYAPLVKGINRANSVIWDMHKMMRTTTLCAAVLFKDPNQMASTFQQEGSYIFHEKEKPGFDLIPYTIECTKSGLATKLFWVLACYGEQNLSNYIEKQYDFAKACYDLIHGHDSFACPYYPEANIICFRYVGENSDDAMQLKIRNSIVKEGNFYITSCDIKNQKYLRLTLMNELTTNEHISLLLDAILEIV